MLEKITIVVLIIANLLLWVPHFKMKMVIGSLVKRELEFVEEIKEILEGALK